MEIFFKDKKLKKACEDIAVLKKKYGAVQGELIIQRINELSSAENLFDISRLPQAGLHSLKGEFKGCFAVSIKQPFRLIMRYENGNSGDLKSITQVTLEEVINYH